MCKENVFKAYFYPSTDKEMRAKYTENPNKWSKKDYEEIWCENLPKRMKFQITYVPNCGTIRICYSCKIMT